MKKVQFKFKKGDYPYWKTEGTWVTIKKCYEEDGVPLYEVIHTYEDQYEIERKVTVSDVEEDELINQD